MSRKRYRIQWSGFGKLEELTIGHAANAAKAFEIASKAALTTNGKRHVEVVLLQNQHKRILANAQKALARKGLV